jgi:methylglutaconyl-CoA hydratase
VFDAGYAQRIGLVDEIVEDAQGLSDAADRIIEMAMACSPDAVAASKELVADLMGREINHQLMDDTARRIARARVSPEGQEGVRAFLAKRKPSWATGN